MLQELFLAARPSDLRFGGDFLGVFFFFGDGSAGSSSLSTTGALGIGDSGCGLRLREFEPAWSSSLSDDTADRSSGTSSWERRCRSAAPPSSESSSLASAIFSRGSLRLDAPER